MERLEKKRVNGNEYYYYSTWERVNGRCRRVRQVYLGKLCDIVSKLCGTPQEDAYAEVFSRGLPCALWNEALGTKTIEIVDEQCPKRAQGMSVGQYIALAAVNRAADPKSKRGFWEWFSGTSLFRALPAASKENLSSQRFWDHMHRIKEADVGNIWKKISARVIDSEQVDLSSLHLDGTNFYTFIDTFNTRSELAKYGKNKQKRNDLRQVNYCVVCSERDQIPLVFDAYPGNRSDYTEFPVMVSRLQKQLQEITGGNESPSTTLVFDKGNNSIKNLKMLDEMGLHFVTSIRASEVKDLAKTPSNSRKFKACSDEDLVGTKCFRVTHDVLGATRTVVVTHSQTLYERERKTVGRNVDKALDALGTLQQKLRDWAEGVINRGAGPTEVSARKQCEEIRNKSYLRKVIEVEVTIDRRSKRPLLKYELDEAALANYYSTELGKTILITSRDNWETEQIIKSYRSQHVVESVFKDMKNRDHGTWWPMHHWTDSKIRVHALYCTIALLYRALLQKRTRDSGVQISSKRLLTQLDDIKEVVYVQQPKKQRRKKSCSHTVLSKLNDLQKKLVSVLGLELNRTSS